MQSMNFFEHQHVARRNTRLLILLFTAAVIILVLLTGAAVAFFTGGVNTGNSYNTASYTGIQWDIVLASCGLVLSGISLAVLYKWAVLRPGGRVVAESLGGRHLKPNSQVPLERKILNVVEEMAIAANIPVPPVYLLDHEPGINAFAAGYSPKDAVIGITAGCVKNLTRSQLQGVIAHEIAHILNGDMRMNIRIMAVLNGILFISHAGYLLLRTGAFRGNQKNSRNALPILGLILIVLGAIGVLFGNIIKAAVSRQREYLADASAVQFTRDPESIGGALQQIGALQAGSQIDHQNATEASHLFFSQAIPKWSSFMATHPPLQARIKRVLPHWDGTFKLNPRVELEQEAQPKNSAGLSAGQKQTAALTILAGIPMALRHSAREPDQVESLVLALLLSDSEETQAQQRAYLAQEHAHLFPAIETHWSRIKDLGTEKRLAMAELSLPALKTRPQAAKQSLLLTLKALQNHQKITLYDWCIAQLISRYLQADLTPSTKVHKVKMMTRTDAELSLSILAWYGHPNEQEAEAAFYGAAQAFGTHLQPIQTRPFSFSDLSLALDRISSWPVIQKEQLVKAWYHCVAHDGEATPIEQKLLLTLAACIGQPVPDISRLAQAHSRLD